MVLGPISPLDGRYKKYIEPVNKYFSEETFIITRIFIEEKYFEFLIKLINELSSVKYKSVITENNINTIIKRVKEIELITNHDVKAIEYFLIEYCKTSQLVKYTPFIHFGLTSEDVNSVARSFIIKKFIIREYIPVVKKLNDIIYNLGKDWDIPKQNAWTSCYAN